MERTKESEPPVTANYTPDFTKTGDVFVSRDGTEWTFDSLDRSCGNTQPVYLRNTGSLHRFCIDGEYIRPDISHDWDIVSQYTPAASEREVRQEIPQWAKQAAKEIGSYYDTVTKDSSYTFYEGDIENIIARHASTDAATPPAKPDGATFADIAESRIRKTFSNDLTQPIPGEAKVERYDGGSRFNGSVVTAADHDAAMAKKDATIAELRAQNRTIPGEGAKVEGVNWYVLRHREEGCGLLSSPPGLIGMVVKADDYEAAIAAKDAENAELMCELRDLQATNDDQGDALIAATKRAEQVAAEWEIGRAHV
jgi:hypothetical protein